MSIHGYAALSAKDSLIPYKYDPQPLKPWEIEVKITHCGICHSDLHLIDNDWGNSLYPLIPGHEIIGTITAVGDQADFKTGQRVGIGWQRSSCLKCEWCQIGDENICSQIEATCVGHPGGFAERIRADGRFAFLIPEALSSEHTAPLLCGGATVFSPFIEHGVTATTRVGVIGIGGLDHLALQFARALGCEVTAFSSSPDKKEEALRLGAHHFVSSKDEAALNKIKKSLDFILCTISEPLNWETYLQILRPKGILCFVGAQSKPIQFPYMALLDGKKTICASNIANRHQIRDMLRVAADHGIKAQIELYPLQDVNKAIERLRQGKVRYRAVLTN